MSWEEQFLGGIKQCLGGGNSNLFFFFLFFFFGAKPAFFDAFSWDSAKVVKVEHIDQQDQHGIISGHFSLGDLQVIQPRGNEKNNGKSPISNLESGCFLDVPGS